MFPLFCECGWAVRTGEAQPFVLRLKGHIVTERTGVTVRISELGALGNRECTQFSHFLGAMDPLRS